mgnify:CR=1 FL=1
MQARTVAGKCLSSQPILLEGCISIQYYTAMLGGPSFPTRHAPRKLPGPLPSLGATHLLDQVRERARYLHYSLRTERAYVYWVRAFVRFHGCRQHPREMGAAEVEAFLTWLAAERNVSASTHGQCWGHSVGVRSLILPNQNWRHY